MKKLYFLNEEESKRILNLHKQATKKQYLSEQSLPDQEMDEQVDWGRVGSSAAVGAAGGAFLGGVGAVPGAVIGAAVSLLSQAFGGGASLAGAKKILDACNVKGAVGPAKMTRQELNAIADGINAAIEGMGTDEDAIKSNLSKIQTIPDLCGMAKTYETRHGESLFDAIDGDIDSSGEWKTYVFLPLLDAFENTKELSAKLKTDAAAAAGKIVGSFAKFPCVAKHPKAKLSTMSNGSEVYDINGVIYYNNGRKMSADRTMSNYTCTDPEFSATTTVAATAGKKTGNYGAVSTLQPKTKTIQSNLGVSQTGTMDQTTIDALITKLNGSGTTTQAAQASTSNTGTV